jgi:hypothetical protein
MRLILAAAMVVGLAGPAGAVRQWTCPDGTANWCFNSDECVPHCEKPITCVGDTACKNMQTTKTETAEFNYLTASETGPVQFTTQPQTGPYNLYVMGNQITQYAAPTPSQQKQMDDTRTNAEAYGKALSNAMPVVLDKIKPELLREAVPIIETSIKDNLFKNLNLQNPCPPEAKRTSDATYPTCNIAVGINAMTNATAVTYSTFIGTCAGYSVHSGRNILLIGDYTSAPDGANGFVNIGNKLCFWRESGERVACPPPEPECGK